MAVLGNNHRIPNRNHAPSHPQRNPLPVLQLHNRNLKRQLFLKPLRRGMQRRARIYTPLHAPNTVTTHDAPDPPKFCANPTAAFSN